jgi:hypothetical protein
VLRQEQAAAGVRQKAAREPEGRSWIFAMEHEGIFGSAIDAVFREEDIRAALNSDLQPLFSGR